MNTFIVTLFDSACNITRDQHIRMMFTNKYVLEYGKIHVDIQTVTKHSQLCFSFNSNQLGIIFNSVDDAKRLECDLLKYKIHIDSNIFKKINKNDIGSPTNFVHIGHSNVQKHTKRNPPPPPPRTKLLHTTPSDQASTITEHAISDQFKITPITKKNPPPKTNLLQPTSNEQFDTDHLNQSPFLSEIQNKKQTLKHCEPESKNDAKDNRTMCMDLIKSGTVKLKTPKIEIHDKPQKINNSLMDIMTTYINTIGYKHRTEQSDDEFDD